MPIPEEASRKFMEVCVKTQLDIALRVRAAQNFDYILYDTSFHRTTHILIGGYRVETDSMGRKAVLCAAAQKTLTRAQYLELTSHPDIVEAGSAVYLRAIPLHKSRSEIPTKE